MGKITIGNKVFEISFIDSAFLKIFALNGLLDAFLQSLAKTVGGKSHCEILRNEIVEIYHRIVIARKSARIFVAIYFFKSRWISMESLESFCDSNDFVKDFAFL